VINSLQKRTENVVASSSCIPTTKTHDVVNIASEKQPKSNSHQHEREIKFNSIPKPSVNYRSSAHSFSFLIWASSSGLYIVSLSSLRGIREVREIIGNVESLPDFFWRLSFDHVCNCFTASVK
jgi:hypothetical protein